MTGINDTMSERAIPDIFEAFEETAAYINAAMTRSEALTLARAESWRLADHLRTELRVRRVYVRPIAGQEAEEFFDGEYDNGWIECPKAAKGAEPMWKVEVRYDS